AVSLDGGATYSTAVRVINNIRGIRNTTAGKNHRVASFPSTAADISGSGNNGTLYVVWPNVGVPGTNTGTDVDVYMSKSSDGGATWSTPSRVNQDPSGLGKKHYHCWITSDPETGNLSVIFYDDRDVSSTDCEVYVANSLTGGDTWEDFKVSDVSFTPAPIPGLAGGYFGDYLSISARGGRVYPCWTDNRSGSALTYVSVFQLADPDDPNPPDAFDAYSDYLTPTDMALSWTDPTTLVNGTPITSSDFEILISRDGAQIATVAGGVEGYTDTGLSDGTLYAYTAVTRLLLNDSTSLAVGKSWHAGGSPVPAAPANLVCDGSSTVDAVLTWNDPTTQNDGTPLDDLDSLRIWRDGVVVATVAPGVETYTDTPPLGFVYQYAVSAVDNESPRNESNPSNVVSCYVGSTPKYLVWVGPDAAAASAQSGDSIFAALVANGESSYLTNDLFEFGNDLSIYDGVFVVLGIFSNNHTIGSGDPEGPALDAYLAGGGKIYLEGGDCFNYDPEVGGYQIRPWFDLDDGPDGSGDLTAITGLNDLSAFSFNYVGENNWMDELQPVTSIPIWQNSGNSDMSGVYYAGYNGGTGSAIGVVPSFGGLVDSPTPVSKLQRPLAASEVVRKAADNGFKTRQEREAQPFVKKAAYYPELKANRKQPGELYRINADGGLEMLANTKVDLMAAYLDLLGAGSSSGANPNPPADFTAYSDYTTPTDMALSWTDPSTYGNGDPLTDFTIEVYRDGGFVASVAMGTGNYTDTGLTDGQVYNYEIYAKDLNDSTSTPVAASWTAGGAATPSAPDSLEGVGGPTEAVLTWTDPTTQIDGTPLDDLDHINIYRDGALIGSVPAGTGTYTDTPPQGVSYDYHVTAVDNEVPENESAPSNTAGVYVGGTTNFLVWVGPDAAGAGAASGDSIFAALAANGESVFLTNDLFEFGNDLSVYEGIFVVLGIFSNNHVIAATGPEGPALDAYLANGGRIYLEGGDCFNYDPEQGGYQIRPWFDLDDGPDGSGDLAGVNGLNDLSAFNFSYAGENNWMDELQPLGSTPVWQNNANTDISGVFNVGYNNGGGRAIGVVPSFGGLVDSPSPVSPYLRPLAASAVPHKPATQLQKIRAERGEAYVLKKKGAYYPELKANRKKPGELYRIKPGGGLEILANTKVDLMAAYLELFRSTGAPAISVVPTALADTLFVDGTNDHIVTVSNAGGTLAGDLTYSITENPAVDWLSATPLSGTLGANSSDEITVSLDASGLAAGDYSTTLEVASNDTSNSLVTVTVDLHVSDPPIINVNPTEVSEVLNAVGDSVDVPMQLSNTGGAPLVWSATVVAFKNGRVVTGKNGSKGPAGSDYHQRNSEFPYVAVVTEDTWDLQFSANLEVVTGALGNAGSEFDGTYYYTTRWATNLLHKIDMGGNLVEEFSVSGVTGLRDLAFDGTYMYGGAAGNTIYQMDFNSKTLVGTISSPVAVRHIAYDEANDAFWVGNWDTDVALVSRSGATLSTISAAAHGLGGMYGSAYDKYSTGGPYLWLFDQGLGAGFPQLLHQIDLSTNTPTGVTYDVTTDFPTSAGIAGGLFVTEGIVSGTVSLGGLLQGTPDNLFAYELT
ncbi:MAG: hypothetical protein KDI38_22250, partial [Calditrichaeota bacterium]|nr:hypothetical protein [Calditrichota bacterium]